MSLKLYFHPLSSFCHKALIALYEAQTPFEPVFVDLSDEKSSATMRSPWPMAKFPVLRDEARNCTVAESTVIIEYLDTYYPGPTRFVPADPDLAWQTRMRDRFYDLYVHLPLQKIVGDSFSLADCAASPAQFYANTVEPFGSAERNLQSYFGRLMSRPSYVRTIEEAQPYFVYFPMETKPRAYKEMQ